MRARSRSRWAGRRGSIAVVVCVGLVALCGAAALTMDLGKLMLAREQLQQTADAAAMAGIGRLAQGSNAAAARQAAQEIITANPVLGSAVGVEPNVDITVGAWDAATSQIVPWLVAPDGSVSVPGGVMAVGVRLRRTAGSPSGPIPADFGRVLGIGSMSVSASATAGLSVQSRQRVPVDLTVVLDFSGSFGNEFSYARDALRDFTTALGPVALPGPSDGFGDNLGYLGFGDYAIDSTNYPSAGWTDPVYGSWSKSNISRNYPLALTRMDTSLGQMAAVDKYVGYNKTFHFSCGSQNDPERYNSRLYSSSTNTADGLLTAAGMMKDANGQWLHSASRHVVMLVSDGMPFFHAPDGTKTEAYSKAQTTAAANTLGNQGIVLHVVTLCQDGGGTSYGFSGSDAAYNASLARNGGYSFHSADPLRLKDMVMGVGAVEYGQPKLLK